MNDLKLIILDNILEFGNKTNEYLKKINNTNEDYIISICRDRFSNGEGKIKINDTIRDKDIYILTQHQYIFHNLCEKIYFFALIQF